MLKLSWGEINEKPFISAIMTLNGNPKLDRATAYRIGRIGEVIRRELQKAHTIELEKATKYAEKDEKGEIVYEAVPGGQRPKVAQEKWATLDKEMQEVFSTHFAEIKVHKLDFNELSGLTGEQLIAIEKICDNLPAEE